MPCQDLHPRLSTVATRHYTNEIRSNHILCHRGNQRIGVRGHRANSGCKKPVAERKPHRPRVCPNSLPRLPCRVHFALRRVVPNRDRTPSPGPGPKESFFVSFSFFLGSREFRRPMQMQWPPPTMYLIDLHPRVNWRLDSLASCVGVRREGCNHRTSHIPFP